MLLEVGKITGQQNKEFVHWIDQKRWPNPADLLSKFCLETDTVESWVSKAKEVLKPGWLQNHSDTYLQSMLERSEEKISLQALGGTQPDVEISEDSPDLIYPGGELVERTCCAFLIVSDSVLESSPLGCNTSYAILDRLVNKYSNYFTSVPLRIFGRAVLISHHWQSKAKVKMVQKRNTQCAHRPNCSCRKKALGLIK